MTPNETIVSFISNLPPAIKDSVCTLVICYLSDFHIRPNTDVERVVIEMIHPDRTSDHIGAALRVSAVLDYLFEAVWAEDNSELNAAIMVGIADRTGNEGMRTGAMQQPLYEKYRQAARKRWGELRRTELTLGRIQDYERILQKELFGKWESTPEQA